MHTEQVQPMISRSEKVERVMIFGVKEQFEGNTDRMPWALYDPGSQQVRFAGSVDSAIRIGILHMFQTKETTVVLWVEMPNQEELPFKEHAWPFPVNHMKKLYALLDRPLGNIEVHIKEPSPR